ncbi:MAG: HEAT repeat domain-containing protein [Candidatus Riflebacteria bacterium]|nr:HEAT repeat domain-containing protein [Candidatus Riflebacteria bacterium]
MINALLILLAALIVIVLVFVIFTQDDQEDELVKAALESPEKEQAALSAGNDGSKNAALSEKTNSESLELPEKPLEPFKMPPDCSGKAEDLQLRLLMEDRLAPLTDLKIVPGAVVVVVQLRFSKEILSLGASSLNVLQTAEKILQPRLSPFPYSAFLTNQMDRLWLFGFDEERDDPVFEALVSAYDVVARFKKAIESDEALRQANARISIGISTGEVVRTIRGTFGPLSHAGMAVYMAEVLAEAAGDFMIHVDEPVHSQAVPFFDFREWRPIKLRHVLPAIAFFEVMGLNKKEELFAFASHAESRVRRAVAVAYRYLEIEENGPLFGLLSDPDEKVVIEALSTVSEIGDDRALGILKKILPEAQKTVVKSAIIEAMGKIAKEDILPILLASTKDTNWLVRFNASRSLYRVAKGEALKHLEHLLKDENGAIRAMINGIFFLQNGSDKHLLNLRDLLTDLSVRARRAAIDALTEIGNPQAIFMISESWSQQDPETQSFLLKKLMNLNSPILYQAFLNMFKNADEKGRAEIAVVMKKSGIGGINAD